MGTQMEDENEDLIVNGNGICNGNGVIPERRHSSNEGSRSSRGEVRVTVNRRHSLPGTGDTSCRSSNGCVIEIHGRDVSPESAETSMPETSSTAVLVTDDLVKVDVAEDT